MELTQDHCQEWFDSLAPDEKRAVALIIQELAAARRKHPAFPFDPVHGAAIVGEEAGELLRAALNFEYEDGAPDEMAKEATQTAATCIRFLVAMPLAYEPQKQPAHAYND